MGVLIAMTMAITMGHSRTKSSFSSTRDSIVRSSNMPWLSIRASLLFEVSIAASERMWRSIFQLLLVQFRGLVDFMVTSRPCWFSFPMGRAFVQVAEVAASYARFVLGGQHYETF